jgi:Flp pilus assembly protein TadD
MKALVEAVIGEAERCLLRKAPGDALRCLRMGLTLAPEHPLLWEMSAGCAASVGDDAVAEMCWRRVTEIDPQSAQAWNHLGVLFDRGFRYDEAAVAYRRALELAPDDASVLTNHALLLENLGDYVAAEAEQRRALALAPRLPAVQANLAGLRLRAGAVAEAEALYRQAIAANPAFATAHSNLGVLLTDLGRFAEAEACFLRALAFEPDYAAARSNLSQLLLVQGRLAEGWPYFEARGTVSEMHRRLVRERGSELPRWQGEDLAGKSLLVLPEQGLGDEIQFARYLPWLKRQGVRRLTYVCRPGQKRLMLTLDGPDCVVDLDELDRLGDYDCWTFVMSLPLHHGTTLANIPVPVPYFSVDPAARAAWAERLPSGPCRVGVVWRGNPKHSNDADRSLPGLAALAPLWSVPGVRFVSLQKTPGGLAAADFPPAQPLFDAAAVCADFADTAAVVVNLDLVICVDTSTGHLAGALGIPVWVLLPVHKLDWRWLLERDDTPWYPQTRLFRQKVRGDWATPVAAVTAALREFATVHKGM